jgi:hypothetical protein
MKIPQIPPLAGMSPLGVSKRHPLPTASERRNCECSKCGSHIPTREEHFAELFEAPFNLAGESQSSELTSEGEARVCALAEAEARKAPVV